MSEADSLGDDDFADFEGDFGDDGEGDFGDFDPDFPGAAQNEDQSALDVQLKNLTYLGDDESDPLKALELFQQAIKMAEEKSDELNADLLSYVFKSMKSCTILCFKLARYDEILTEYERILKSIDTVPTSEGNKAIEEILSTLDHGNPNDQKQLDLKEKIYTRTVTQLSAMSGRERMAFDIQMRQAIALVSQAEFAKATALLNKLHKLCMLPDGSDDKEKKASELIDIYALEMRMAGDQLDNEKIKQLYEKTKVLTADVRNPKSQSIIQECWGKMWGDDGQWGKAYADFYLAFTTYLEAGMNDKAKQCLTYVIVSNMLSGGEQNPFDAREAQSFQKDGDMQPVIKLRKSKQKRDVKGFQKALSDFEKQWGDKWLKKHMESMIADFHKVFILKFVKPYEKLKIAFLSHALEIDFERVEWYLVQMILDGDIIGKVDQVNGILDLKQSGVGGVKKYHAMQTWAGVLDTLARNLPQPTTSYGPTGGYRMHHSEY